MSLAMVHTRAMIGVQAPSVTVEVHVSRGLPGWSMVGLPEKAVKESKERVRSALLNAGFELKAKRITINLAPAELPKEGGRFDLPIAIGVLVAYEVITQAMIAAYEFAGELSLHGDLLAIRGALPLAMATHSAGRKLILPSASAAEASLLASEAVMPASDIVQVVRYLRGECSLSALDADTQPPNAAMYPDMADIKGQAHARRALEIAAAGGHSILFKGPPGTGKTMLASRLPGILPPMQDTEALATAAIYSISQQGFSANQWRRRPFRSPHHSASAVALVGGGSPPRPGEISLAHHGVLFLDELPEFSRHVLESLREPLEAGQVTISRAARQAVFPARFQLIAAMNPCPCGYLGDSQGQCRCTSEQVQRYQARISGPLLDRIDLHVVVPRIAARHLFAGDVEQGEASEQVRQRVLKARERQWARSACANAELGNAEIAEVCGLKEAQQQLMLTAIEKCNLSARAYHRVLKVARTVADLEGSADIASHHLQEVLSYRGG